MFPKTEQQAKVNTVLQFITNNHTFKCGFHLTIRICTT